MSLVKASNCASVIVKVNFCFTKNLKKLHLLLTKVAKSCICAQAF